MTRLDARLDDRLAYDDNSLDQNGILSAQDALASARGSESFRSR